MKTRIDPIIESAKKRGISNASMMRERLLARAGIPTYNSLEQIRSAQWSPEFEDNMRELWRFAEPATPWSYEFIRLMKNRLIMGALRYGLSDNPEKRHFNCARLAADRLYQFEENHDLEMLVDVANMALLTYVESNRKGVVLNMEEAKEKAMAFGIIINDPFWPFYITRDKSSLVILACRVMSLYSFFSTQPGYTFGTVGENVKHATL